MTKIVPIILWVGTIFAAGLKAKYPELGGVVENILTGAIGAGATGLLFSKSIGGK